MNDRLKWSGARATSVALVLTLMMAALFVITPEAQAQTVVIDTDFESVGILQGWTRGDENPNGHMNWVSSPARGNGAMLVDGDGSAQTMAVSPSFTQIDSSNEMMISFDFWLPSSYDGVSLAFGAQWVQKGGFVVDIGPNQVSISGYNLDSLHVTQGTNMTDAWHNLRFEQNGTASDVYYDDGYVLTVSKAASDTVAINSFTVKTMDNSYPSRIFIDNFWIADHERPTLPSLPDPTFHAGPSGGYAPLEVRFTPANTGYDAYDWNFGDGTTGSGATPVHTFTVPGTYNVTLNVTSGGMYAESWQHITVDLEPKITSTPSTSAVVGSVYSYVPNCNIEVSEWTLSTNATFLEINNGTGMVTGEIGASDIGWYAINITARTSPECSQSYILTVSALDWQVTVTVKATVTDLKASFSYALSDPSLTWAVASVTWSFGDGSTATGATVSHTYAKAGTYTVTCTVTNVLDDDAVGSRSVTTKKAATSTGDGSGGGDGSGSSTDGGSRSSLWIAVIIVTSIALVAAIVLSGGQKVSKGRRKH